MQVLNLYSFQGKPAGVFRLTPHKLGNLTLLAGRNLASQLMPTHQICSFFIGTALLCTGFAQTNIFIG